MGRTIHLSGTLFTIIGVAPRSSWTQGLPGRGIWVPIVMQPTVMPAAENWLVEHMSRNFWLTVVGRVKPEYTSQGAIHRGRPERARPADDQTRQSR